MKNEKMNYADIADILEKSVLDILKKQPHADDSYRPSKEFLLHCANLGAHASVENSYLNLSSNTDFPVDYKKLLLSFGNKAIFEPIVFVAHHPIDNSVERA